MDQVHGSARQLIGAPHPTHDAIGKVTGATRYGTDMQLPGMLHARLVLSEHAHARVVAVHTTEALEVPGVVAVFTHHDAPDRRYNRYRLVAGQLSCVDDERVLNEVARCVGDRVAVVVARTASAAAEGARAVRVEVQALPVVLDARQALDPEASSVHPGGNLIHEFDHADRDGIGAGDTITEFTTSVTTQRLHHAALEPHVAIADASVDGRLTVWTTGQSTFGVRTLLASLFDLDEAGVRVIKAPTGGSFGGKQEFILEPVAAFCALALHRPVMVTMDRAQLIVGTMVRPTQTSSVTTTHDAAGRLRTLDIDTLLDAGAYATSSPDYSSAMTHKLGRLYRMDRYRHRGRVVYTNTPVAGGFRGWGAPDITTCIEIHMDAVADELGIDPVEFRRRSLVYPGDVDPSTGMNVGDARIRECLDRGAAAFGWDELRARPRDQGRIRRGVGVAVGAHKNGMWSPSWPDDATVVLTVEDDATITVTTAVHEMGQGSLVVFRLLVADVLDVEPERVVIVEADTDLDPFDLGCYGSRMTYVVGAAVAEAAGVLRDHLAAVAGRPPDGADLGALARRCRAEGRPLTVTHRHCGVSNPGAYSAQFSEVTVDVLTGLVTVERVVAAADVGRAINPQMVIGQYQGAVLMGIGAALSEEVALDAEGRPLRDGFAGYHLVNMPAMPHTSVVLVEHEGDNGPFGAKSVGEIAIVPTAAAIVNAVNRALGVRITTLPATPARVVAALVASGVDGDRVLEQMASDLEQHGGDR
jgi:xanthine dehydrogenase molybdenum-binding subunit